MEYDDSDPEDVVLLDCDSISQAKEKILDAIYKVFFKMFESSKHILQ